MQEHASSRHVLVTGGTSGIGFATAALFARAGNPVTVVGRSADRLDNAVADLSSMGNVAGAVCDVSDEASVERLFQAIDAVAVLVANAGVSMSARFADTSVADLERAHHVNVRGTFLCLRAALPTMREVGWGRAVVISSISGHVGLRNVSAYTASKHAAVGLTRAAAAEVAGSNVTVNAVCPTYVRTPMTEAAVERVGTATGRDPDSAAAFLTRSSPLGRLLEPEEVAHAVKFLCSDLAGAINGQSVVMDGGGLQH